MERWKKHGVDTPPWQIVNPFEHSTRPQDKGVLGNLFLDKVTLAEHLTSPYLTHEHGCYHHHYVIYNIISLQILPWNKGLQTHCDFKIKKVLWGNEGLWKVTACSSPDWLSPIPQGDVKTRVPDMTLMSSLVVTSLNCFDQMPVDIKHHVFYLAVKPNRNKLNWMEAQLQSTNKVSVTK